MRKQLGSGRRAGVRRGGRQLGQRPIGAGAETLEPRTLLAFAPLGPEFRPPGFDLPSVAADADGDFVIVSDVGAAQRYSATGAAVGPSFNVKTNFGTFPTPASVAM